jgi:putative tricarboxylic transport membrane protein
LAFGIPSNNMMAMMLSALMIHGITPGPTVLHTQPEIFWGLLASMWVINLPLIGVWVRLLSVPYRLLCPAILLF